MRSLLELTILAIETGTTLNILLDNLNMFNKNVTGQDIPFSALDRSVRDTVSDLEEKMENEVETGLLEDLGVILDAHQCQVQLINERIESIYNSIFNTKEEREEFLNNQTIKELVKDERDGELQGRELHGIFVDEATDIKGDIDKDGNIIKFYRQTPKGPELYHQAKVDPKVIKEQFDEMNHTKLTNLDSKFNPMTNKDIVYGGPKNDPNHQLDPEKKAKFYTGPIIDQVKSNERLVPTGDGIISEIDQRIQDINEMIKGDMISNENNPFARIFNINATKDESKKPFSIPTFEEFLKMKKEGHPEIAKFKEFMECDRNINRILDGLSGEQLNELMDIVFEGEGLSVPNPKIDIVDAMMQSLRDLLGLKDKDSDQNLPENKSSLSDLQKEGRVDREEKNKDFRGPESFADYMERQDKKYRDNDLGSNKN